MPAARRNGTSGFVTNEMKGHGTSEAACSGQPGIRTSARLHDCARGSRRHAQPDARPGGARHSVRAGFGRPDCAVEKGLPAPSVCRSSILPSRNNAVGVKLVADNCAGGQASRLSPSSGILSPFGAAGQSHGKLLGQKSFQVGDRRDACPTTWFRPSLYCGDLF